MIHPIFPRCGTICWQTVTNFESSTQQMCQNYVVWLHSTYRKGWKGRNGWRNTGLKHWQSLFQGANILLARCIFARHAGLSPFQRTTEPLPNKYKSVIVRKMICLCLFAGSIYSTMQQFGYMHVYTCVYINMQCVNQQCSMDDAKTGQAWTWQCPYVFHLGKACCNKHRMIHYNAVRLQNP